MTLSEEIRNQIDVNVPQAHMTTAVALEIVNRVAKLEAESKAGARLGIAVRRSNAYNIVNLFYKTAVDGADATFHKDLKLLEPIVEKDGAILVSDELAALEADAKPL